MNELPLNLQLRELLGDDGLLVNGRRRRLVLSETGPDGGNRISGVTTTGQAVVNVTMGDSRFANGRADSASSEAAAANGSLTQLSAGDAYTSWSGPQYVAQFLSGGLIEVRDFAQSGSRVTPVPGRSDDVVSYQYPAALAATDEFVLGSIWASANDRSASPLANVADTLSDYSRVIRGWAESGRRMEVVLEPPQRGSYWTGTAPVEWAAFVERQRKLALERPALVALIDTAAMSVANGIMYPQGDNLDPYYDVVHPKFRGGWLVGKGLHDARIARGWLPQNPVRAALQRWRDRLADNKCTNPTLSGSTTGIGSGGTGPASWSTARTASNSWDSSRIADGVPTLYATATAYAAGARVVHPALPAYDYVCIVAGTSGGSAPAFSQTAFSTTTDGGVTWLTVPRCDDFYGVNSVLIYGVGTANNTRAVVQQDVSLASTGFGVGDEIEASIFLAALQGFYGAQIELQAMTGTTKIRSTFGMLCGYMDSSAVVPNGTTGRIQTCGGFVIPAGTDTLRIKVQAYSVNGRSLGMALAAPELRRR